jgi:hypothetical protein
MARMTQILLNARLDVVAALLAAAATADALHGVKLLAAAQYHLGLALRLVVLDAREQHTLREVAEVADVPHSVLLRQLRGGGPVLARLGRTHYGPDSRNVTPAPDVELPRAS